MGGSWELLWVINWLILECDVLWWRWMHFGRSPKRVNNQWTTGLWSRWLCISLDMNPLHQPICSPVFSTSITQKQDRRDTVIILKTTLFNKKIDSQILVGFFIFTWENEHDEREITSTPPTWLMRQRTAISINLWRRLIWIPTDGYVDSVAVFSNLKN